MGYVKANKETLRQLKTDIATELSDTKTCLETVKNLCDSNHHTYPVWDRTRAREDGYEETYYARYEAVSQYNNACDGIKNAITSIETEFNTEITNINTGFTNIVNAINTFEVLAGSNYNAALAAPDSAAEAVSMEEMFAYEASDVQLTDPEKPVDASEITGDDQTDADDKGDQQEDTGGRKPTGGTQTDTTLDDDPGDDTGPGPTGTEQDPVTTGDEDPGTGDTGPGPTGTEGQDPGTGDDDGTGDTTGPTGDDQTGIDLTDITPPGDTGGTGGNPTSADLIDTAGSMAGRLNGEDDDGLDLEDVGQFGAAGMAGLMLGLNNLGEDDDESYLSNIASGLDDDRTLMDMGLEDVFEHPDYTGGDPNADNLGNELDGVGIGPNGELMDGTGEDGDVDGFNVKGIADGEGNGDGSDAGDLLKGAGAMAGGLALGGLAAGGFMGMDESEGGMFSGKDAYGRSDGSRMTLREMLFGTSDDEDEEEKERQSFREKLAIILTSSGIISTILTFLLSSFGVISPWWLIIALLLFAGGLLYFNIVLDKKNKRREELAAVKEMTGKRSYLNNSQNLANNMTAPTPKVREVDWVLYGLIMLSTSSFILKSYDVINWLIFLLLLILFILIIFVYIELKKKLGEDNKYKGPIRK